VVIYPIILIYGIFLFITIRRILLDIKTPSKSLSWILVSIFIPVIGISIYQLIGTSIKKDSFFTNRKPVSSAKEVIFPHEFRSDKKRLVELLYKNKSAALSFGNSVEVLRNGEETFNRILEEMKKAKSNIHLDFYIIESGKMLSEYLEVIKQKTKEGVKIRMVYDGFRSNNLNEAHRTILDSAGVEYKVFMPFNYFKSIRYINYRNHRKIITIDNQVAFTGGMNISDNYLNDNNSLGYWKDTFIMISGEAAKDLEYVFNCDWHYAGGDNYVIQDVNQESSEKGLPVQVISSGPDAEHKGILQQYFTMITDAEDYVYISTPYFIPGESILTALKTSALSGIDVRLMLPYQSDSRWLKWCMMTYLEELLDAGVVIYFFKSGFLHSKVMISDDIVSSVGSANVDERSFDTNFEVNAIVYDRATTLQLKEYFIEDISKCEILTKESFASREDRNKIMESIARLASPML
jgi:cardiolipin synthase